MARAALEAAQAAAERNRAEFTVSGVIADAVAALRDDSFDVFTVDDARGWRLGGGGAGVGGEAAAVQPELDDSKPEYSAKLVGAYYEGEAGRAAASRAVFEGAAGTAAAAAVAAACAALLQRVGVEVSSSNLAGGNGVGGFVVPCDGDGGSSSGEGAGADEAAAPAVPSSLPSSSASGGYAGGAAAALPGAAGRSGESSAMEVDDGDDRPDVSVGHVSDALTVIAASAGSTTTRASMDIASSLTTYAASSSAGGWGELRASIEGADSLSSAALADCEVPWVTQASTDSALVVSAPLLGGGGRGGSTSGLSSAASAGDLASAWTVVGETPAAAVAADAGAAAPAPAARGRAAAAKRGGKAAAVASVPAPSVGAAAAGFPVVSSSCFLWKGALTVRGGGGGRGVGSVGGSVGGPGGGLASASAAGTRAGGHDEKGKRPRSESLGFDSE